MSEQPIPKDVQRFIADHISSVLVLEALLLLFSSPSRPWNAFELGAELRVAPEWAQYQLEQLTRAGLIRRLDESRPKPSAPPSPPPPPPPPADPRFAFQPGNPFDATLAALAQAYQERRVSIISLIFSKPAEAIQTFADAFNLRKDRQ